MAIVLSLSPPAAGPQALARALRDLRGDPARGRLLGGAGVNLSQPLPVFRLGLEDLRGADSLDRVQQVGWRYLIEPPDGGGVAYADVKVGNTGDPSFVGLSQNRNAERLAQAALLAEEVAAKLPDEYDARILDVPALYTSAIWLAGPTPIFVPYVDAERLMDEKAVVAIDPEFVSRLVERAEIARELFGGGGSDGSRSTEPPRSRKR